MTVYNAVSKTKEKEGFDTHRRTVTVIHHSLATLLCRCLKSVAVRRSIHTLSPGTYFTE